MTQAPAVRAGAEGVQRVPRLQVHRCSASQTSGSPPRATHTARCRSRGNGVPTAAPWRSSSGTTRSGSGFTSRRSAGLDTVGGLTEGVGLGEVVEGFMRFSLLAHLGGSATVDVGPSLGFVDLFIGGVESGWHLVSLSCGSDRVISVGRRGFGHLRAPMSSRQLQPGLGLRGLPPTQRRFPWGSTPGSPCGSRWTTARPPASTSPSRAARPS